MDMSIRPLKTSWYEGFTMIELVMVIAIIGILSAAAIPRFANLTAQAQTAANQGLAGGLGAAIGIAHAAWIAAGASSSTSTVTLDNTAVEVNANGFPDGTGVGSITTATAAGCISLMTTLLLNPPSTATSSCTGSPCYNVTVTGSSPVCTYSLSGTSHSITYNIATGAITAS